MPRNNTRPTPPNRPPLPSFPTRGLTNDDVEAALLLRNFGIRDNDELARARHIPPQVCEEAFKRIDRRYRPAETLNTELLACFVPFDRLQPFFASLARAYCDPLKDNPEAYEMCYAPCADIRQGVNLYKEGAFAGKMIQMRTNFRRAQYIRRECQYYGEIFDDAKALAAYLKEHGYEERDEDEEDENTVE